MIVAAKAVFQAEIKRLRRHGPVDDKLSVDIEGDPPLSAPSIDLPNSGRLNSVQRTSEADPPVANPQALRCEALAGFRGSPYTRIR
ncbi:MAG: hypothetical protein ACRD3Q_17950 [Terriglobales bacterium]